MAILRKNEMRELDEKALAAKLDGLRTELGSEMGSVASGGKATNAGRIREMRRTIARILTLQNMKKRTGAKAPAVVKAKVSKPKEENKPKEETEAV
ncbi:MAG: 50S ribosomal protein L29 [Candidatus Micrarchaeota archaeon]|nr:50S ribosomal protein L29 [Candidatus Micrarchaeota archaeon]